MDYLAFVKTWFPSVTVSDELLNSFIFQAQLTLKSYGIPSTNADGTTNETYNTLLGLFVGCQLQRNGFMDGGSGAVTSYEVSDFKIAYGNLLDRYPAGVPNSGGYCDMFNYLAQQEALSLGTLSTIIFRRGGCK